MKSLMNSAFESIRRSDVASIPEDVLEVKFNTWYAERITDSGVKLKQKVTGALREAAKKALLLAPSKWHDVSLSPKPSSFVRVQLHTAAAWLGLKSFSRQGRRYDKIVQVSAIHSEDPDFKALLSKEEVIARGAKVFEERAPAPREQQCMYLLPRSPIRCDTCDAKNTDREILVSVYHLGQHCTECLSNGLCDSDPMYCSKWESID